MDTTETGVTTSFTGNSKSDFPAEVATSLDALKTFYKRNNYVVETLPAATGKFDSTGNGSGADTQVQVLKVHLKHAKDVKTESIKVVREVTYSVDSKSPDAPKAPDAKVDTFDGVFSRTVTTDKVNGNVTKLDWSGTYTSNGVTSPKLADGYHPDKEVAAKATISADFLKNAGEDEIAKLMSDGLKVSDEVVYTPDMQQLILKVHDQDTDTDLEDPITYSGFSDESVGNDPVNKMSELIKKYQELGYDLVSVPIIDQKYDTTSNYGQAEDSEPQTFMLVLKHHVETVTPDQPKTPTDVIPGTSQNYPSGVDKSDLSKTITRTIIVNLPDGTTKEIKQVVEYGRTATVDAVTKKVTYSDWTAKLTNWPQYDAPSVPGYTPDKEVVDLTHVPVDGEDVTVEINYVAVPDELDTPSEPDTPLTPVTPTTPDKPDKPAKPEKPNKPSKPEKPAKPHTNKPEAQAISDRAKSDKAPEGLTSTEWAHMSLAERERYLKGQALAKHDDKADSGVLGRMDDRDANKLPQTGNRSGLQLTLLGLGLISLALFGLKKKRDDE
ncbi:mucus binding protein [Lactobacillus pasteurii DSM 23907 = CRBIP 24.76]|uniref:Adhesion exoprotein n=1 Tax=Lactobacillus pasteurii DSM 23907 = CRBIP 24.76 TaxID=1423790 RepID=I7JYF9_9LACO|nr:LPXTG cell wall anchor domain-containing protein [Lactobacillus pasteurii]KRK07751.1 mucus binding protein [Lactobacillus pasteurii DSM 23907 = CRBIP 24.76]TDG77528.1 hypothetical protein C5L33_000971 [Lactobacillus pasteurii]CCI85510.1 Adhesion exoprotein [Lactobacillus pasteurii DSM 23907 = CRBIP 24.76]